MTEPVKEEAHENKLTYRHYTEIVPVKNGLTKVIEPRNTPTIGSSTNFPQLLGVYRELLYRMFSGQTNSGCNSAIRSAYNSIQKGEAHYGQFKGIVLYLPLGKVLRNTGCKSMKTALVYIKKYLKLMSETGVIFNVKCIGEVERPILMQVYHDRIDKRIKDLKYIRAERVKDSVLYAIDLYYSGASYKNSDVGLEERWIGVSVEFGKELCSPSHALAQATVVRYLFYNRYQGIIPAFLKILKVLPELNKLEALSLAHYWCKPIGVKYSAYYGLMPENTLMSFVNNPQKVLNQFTKGRVINEAFSKLGKACRTQRMNAFGEKYYTTNAVSTKEHWEKDMLPLVKKNDFKGAYKYLNRWVNGKS